MNTPAFTLGPWKKIGPHQVFAEDDENGSHRMVALSYIDAGNAHLIAAAPELYEALENDILFFDSIANNEHWEATGIGNLCRGYASRRRDLLAKARGEQ